MTTFRIQMKNTILSFLKYIIYVKKEKIQKMISRITENNNETTTILLMI